MSLPCYFKTVLLGAMTLMSSIVFAASNPPAEFLQQQVDHLKEVIKNREIPDPSAREKEVWKIKNTRNAWLKALYKSGGIVVADYTSRMLSDKLIMAKIIEDYLGADRYKYHPKTRGLKNLLIKHNLLDEKGQVIADKQAVASAFQSEFPYGYIVKPAQGIASNGKGDFFYFKTSKFIDDLVERKNELYTPDELNNPHVSELLEIATSGEKVILQENVIKAARSNPPDSQLLQVRVHTLWNEVVPWGSLSRYPGPIYEDKVKPRIPKAEEFVQEFLDALPQEFTALQAWGIDVATFWNADYRIIDINTNRGEKRQWSGFMVNPVVLRAYTWHLKDKFNVRLKLGTRILFNMGLGNAHKAIKKLLFE